MSARRAKSESAIFGLKSAILCAFVALAGCGSTDQIQGKATAAGVTEPAELFLTPMQSSGIQFVTAYDKGVQASTDALGRVKKAMEAVLFDPTSAQFSGIRVGRQGAVCGKYNAKNRYGAYVGFRDFVMTADGRVVTNDTSGTDDSSQTLYYSNYVEACGTKAEIAAYRNANNLTPSMSAPTETATPPEQEPDQVLDAPPPRKLSTSNIPTA